MLFSGRYRLHRADAAVPEHHVLWKKTRMAALGDIHRHFAWQAWHAWHWAGSGGALGFRCGAVAPRRFAWQAWHLATCSCTLSGRHSTWRHVAALCVAGTALGDM